MCRRRASRGRIPIAHDLAVGLIRTWLRFEVQAITRWVLTVAHNQAISEQDRVVHGGETYEVARVDDTHSNRTARRAYLVRVD